jgi:hypothetical protein
MGAEPMKPKQGNMSQTMTLYNKFRAIKDRYRNNLIMEHNEKDKQLQIEAMKQGSGMELKGLNSFDKQENDLEFAEYKTAEYSQLE